MARTTVLGTILASALAVAAFAADADKGAPAPIKSDASLLNEGFDAPGCPKSWDLSPEGGNRRDAAFKDGRCILNPGEGDNNITLPPLKADLDKDVVLEVSFAIPAATTGGYSVLSMTRESGEFQVVILPAGDAQRVVMGKERVALGAIEPGKVYTLALLFRPDGECKGVLTGPGIDKPAVQSVKGVDGVIHKTVIGNVFGAGSGSLWIEQVRAGKPVK
jgi:hypothetical protein